MPKRILEGKVVSDKQDKTITVLVERRYMHPVYKKYIKRTDKYAAHDEHNAIKEGAVVQIQECRPISKRKTWTVITGGEQTETPKKTVTKKAEPKAKSEPKKSAKPKAKETKDSKKKA